MAVTQSESGAVDARIELPENIKKFLEQPRCADIGLPEPGNVKLSLPTGGTIKGVGDFTKGIPTDCSLNISLLLQLGPILANMECFIRVLKLIKPLIDVINGLPFPPVEAIKNFGEAAAEVTECIVKFTTPVGMVPFVRDILLLVIKILNCMIDQMKSLLALISSLNFQVESAQGNDALLANLECAKDNAQKSANSMMQSIEPVMVILEMISPLLEIAQAPALEIPTLGDVEGVEQMEQFVGSIEGFVDTLQLVVDALPG